MLAILLASIVSQGMFGTPAAPQIPEPPVVDRSAAIIERMAANRHDMLAEMTKLHEEVAGLQQQLAAAAARSAPEPTVVTLPAPPPQKVYVARDAAGFNWEGPDQDRLLDWVEQQNLRKRGALRPASIVATSPPPLRTYTMPTYTMPARAMMPVYTYTIAPRGAARVCGPNGCSQ